MEGQALNVHCTIHGKAELMSNPKIRAYDIDSPAQLLGGQAKAATLRINLRPGPPRGVTCHHRLS